MHDLHMHTYKGWWKIVLDLSPLENKCFCEVFDFSVCRLVLIFRQTCLEL